MVVLCPILLPHPVTFLIVSLNRDSFVSSLIVSIKGGSFVSSLIDSLN